MGVEFNENRPNIYNEQTSKQGGLTGFIIKLGLANNENSANKVMLVIAIICFVLAIYIAF